MIIPAIDHLPSAGGPSEASSNIPSPANLCVLQTMSLFELLLIQQIRPLPTAESAVEDHSTESFALVRKPHETDVKPSRLGTTAAGDSTTAGSMTNLAYFATTQVHPAFVLQSTSTGSSPTFGSLGFASGKGNAFATAGFNTTASSLAAAGTDSKRASASANESPKGDFPVDDFDVVQNSPAENTLNPPVTNRQADGQFAVAIPVIANDQPTKAAAFQSSKHVNSTEPLTSARDDDSRTQLESVMKSSSSMTNQSLRFGVDSISVESRPAMLSAFQAVETVRRPHSQMEDTKASAEPTVSTINLSRPTSAETAAPVSDPLAAAIVENIDNAQFDGPTTVRIQLDLPDLGPVNLHLSVSDNLVSVRIVTRDQRARQIVEHQINDLRQSLKNNGVECGRFEIECDADGQSFAEQRNAGTAAVPTKAVPVSRPSGIPILKSQVAISKKGGVNFVA